MLTMHRWLQKKKNRMYVFPNDWKGKLGGKRKLDQFNRRQKREKRETKLGHTDKRQILFPHIRSQSCPNIVLPKHWEGGAPQLHKDAPALGTLPDLACVPRPLSHLLPSS